MHQLCAIIYGISLVNLNRKTRQKPASHLLMSYLQDLNQILYILNSYIIIKTNNTKQK